MLTAIIIAKDEEKRIFDRVESVVTALEKINEAYEIIVVDSNSSDQTVGIVKKMNYNLKILRINKANQYSASLARHIGATYAKGEYLLFLDGDMIIDSDFIVKALRKLRYRNDSYVGALGIRNDIIKDHFISNVYKINNFQEAKHIGGALFIERKAFLSVGGYDPTFISSEEPELLLRLNSNGYRIVSLPIQMINHFIDEDISEFKKFRKHFKRADGPAKVIRNILKKKYSVKAFRNQKYFLLLVGDYLLNIIIMVTIIFKIVFLLVDRKKAIYSSIYFPKILKGSLGNKAIDYIVEEIQK